MWVETNDGALVNLAQAQRIYVDDECELVEGEGAAVVARFGDEVVPGGGLLFVGGPEECRSYLERLKQRLATAVRLVRNV